MPGTHFVDKKNEECIVHGWVLDPNQLRPRDRQPDPFILVVRWSILANHPFSGYSHVSVLDDADLPVGADHERVAQEGQDEVVGELLGVVALHLLPEHSFPHDPATFRFRYVH